MSLMWLLLDAIGAAIQGWVALGLIFLAVLILSLPRLLGKGLVASCRGVWTLLIPARRYRWLQARHGSRERRRMARAEVDLLKREIEQYGRSEALRRSGDRQYSRATDTGRDPARPDEEPTTP